MRQLLLTFLHLCIFSLCTFAQDVYLKGNIVKKTTMLEDKGNNVYQGEVTLDDSNVFLFSDKYVYFECPDQSYKSGNIRINGGTYTATFNLSTKAWSFEAPVDENRISAFGSSVCNGQGATGNKGYAYLYGEQLKERTAKGESENAFYVSGISIGGNTTTALLNRYGDMTRDHARYVIIGLSMGNEGIHESSNKQQTLNQFSTNMQYLISKIKADGKIPVVMNNYTRGDFTADDYTYIKKMNMLIHQWDVSSVNTLGAIDDGAGHWASGYQQDNAHPTTSGHKEFFYAMPPSLFDAIKSGKAQPVRDMSQEMTLNDGSTIQFKGEGTVHPFTLTLRVKGKSEGLLATVRTETRGFTVKVDSEGHVVYTNAQNKTLTSENMLSDDAWHYVTLTHYWAQGRTLLYVDGKPAVDSKSTGELRERINSLVQVIIGDPATSVSRQFSEIMFWRAGMNPEEVAAVEQGKMLKSSLEFYVPTVSAENLDNKAMSLNQVELVTPEIQGIQENSKFKTQKSKLKNHYDLSGRALARTLNHRQIVIADGKKTFKR